MISQPQEMEVALLLQIIEEIIMSIDISFHFKCSGLIDVFVNNIKSILSINLEKNNQINSYLGDFLGFASTFFQENSQNSYFENFDFYENIKPYVKGYDVIFMLSSSAIQGNIREIQEMVIFNIAYSICFIYKTHGTLVYDDGSYMGTIGYVNGEVINLDTNSKLFFPRIEDLI